MSEEKRRQKRLIDRWREDTAGFRILDDEEEEKAEKEEERYDEIEE